jgi:hypothetical protein
MSALLQDCTSPACLYGETCLCRPLPSFALKAVQIVQIAKLWKSPDTKEIELCAVSCANVQFRAQREAVEVDSKYITFLMYKELELGN